jgi:putative membrane protein
MMWHWFHWGFGGWWIMPVIMIVFWGLIIWGIVALVISAGRRNVKQDNINKESPMDILSVRYARGEITKEEFEERKRVINSKE